MTPSTPSILAYRCRGTERTSAWAVSCLCVALLSAASLTAAVLLAVLPAAWVGHPYLRLVDVFHPGVDAPDNWALAATYFLRIVCGLIALAIVSLVAGNPLFWWHALRGMQVELAR